jgi:SAM-dependent methyltransferase
VTGRGTASRARLRSLLTPRALAAWSGTDRLSALALRLPAGPPATEIARLFALVVGGDVVQSLSEASVHDVLDDLGILERTGDGLRATVSVLPLGPSLLVCDRLDAERGLDLVCWPDDSSYHLARAIPPGRRQRWLDVACGSCFAPLLRPELACSVVAADLNPRAIELAWLGITLSGHDHIVLMTADLTAGVPGTFDLVTCNAPIPADVGPLWRSTADAALFARLFDELPPVLAPDGMAVVHAALDHVLPIVEHLPGERVVVSYVPDGGRQFGIVWWRPRLDATLRVTRRELTTERPHLTHDDRLAALATI